MKVVAKPIEVIAVFKSSGQIEPFKFKYQDRAIKVDKIIEKKVEKLAGQPQEIFLCQSAVCDTEKLYEIKYDILSHSWLLWKF